VMLGDPESPADLGAWSLRVSMRHLPDRFSRHTGFSFCPVESVFFDVSFVGFKSAGGVADEFFIYQPRSNNLPAHRVGEGNVGANVQAQPQLGPACRTGVPRIHDIEFGAVAYALQQMMEENRVGFPRVRTPQQDDVGILNFPVRAGSASRSEYRRQTGDAGSVSSPVTTVDIVRSHDTAHELLRGIVQFVRSLGAAEHPKIARVAFCNRLAERCGNPVHGLVPGGRTMPTVFAHQGLGQPGSHQFRHSLPTRTLEES